MALQKYANAPLPSSPSTPFSTLSGALAAGATSLTVASATPFPTTPQFTISIGDELLLVTGVAGAVFTVSRGVEGTTDADHADGASIFCPLTAASLALLPVSVSEVGISYGTSADTLFARSSVGVMKLSAASATSLLLQNGAAVEVGGLSWSGNTFYLGTQGGVGAGTARDVLIGSALSATNGIYFATEETTRWQITNTGYIRPFATATYDLGDSTHVVRSAYLGKIGNLTSNGLVTTSAGDGTLGITALGTGVATFLSTPSSANLRGALTDETGTGAAVFADTPTLIAPILGTPTSGNLSNCTALPVGSVTGLGSGIAAFLATPSSANLITALTDETGTGACVFANTPTLVTPILGTPQSGVLTSCTGLPLTTGVTGTLGVANGGTGAASASITAFNNITGFSAAGTTGTTSTNLVFSTSPTLVTPALGVATATSLNGNTFTAGTYTLTGVAGKTLTFNKSLTLEGTDSTTMTFPSTSATIARTDAAQSFTGNQTFGGQVFAASGAVGTPAYAGTSFTSSGVWFASGIVHIAQGGTDVAAFQGANAVTYLRRLEIGQQGGSGAVVMTTTGADAMQLGVNVNGTAASQSLSAPNGITGTDTIGGSFTIASGKGTGAGAASSIIFQTPTLTSGTTQQALATRMTIATAGTTIDTLTVTNATTLSSTLAANGTITMGSGIGIATNTGTGTIIATAASQKLGIWGAAAIVQPTTGIAAATFTANTSLIANDTATFDGYTLGQVVKALRNFGLLA